MSISNYPIKVNHPKNRLVGEMPKIGIRPAIDGRLQGIRESLEDQTMNMAQNVAAFLSKNLRHSNGLPVDCVIATPPMVVSAMTQST